MVLGFGFHSGVLVLLPDAANITGKVFFVLPDSLATLLFRQGLVKILGDNDFCLYPSFRRVLCLRCVTMQIPGCYSAEPVMSFLV